MLERGAPGSGAGLCRRCPSRPNLWADDGELPQLRTQPRVCSATFARHRAWRMRGPRQPRGCVAVSLRQGRLRTVPMLC